MLGALTRDGIPAYLSNTAGTYLCNQTMYGTLHALAHVADAPRAGLVHLPSLPSMVAASGLDEPSMDLALMLRGDRHTGSTYVSEHDARAIEVHIANLRRKLGESASHPRWIETVRGVGYRLAL